MKEAVAQYRNIVLTQGSADAFVQAQEYTGIDAGSGYGWMLKRIEVMFPLAQVLEGIAADFSIALSLTLSTQTAVKSLDDSNTLYADGIAVPLTTSGVTEVDRKWEWIAPSGVIVVAPSVFAQLDSTGTSLSLTAHMRVYYEEVKLSEVEILRMLTQG